MSVILKIVGAALILTALVDIYLTVLLARSGRGLLTPKLHRTGWTVLKNVAAFTGGRQRELLEHSGPLLIVATLLTWGLLLLFGFGLFVWPELGSAVQATGNRSTPRDLWTALYFAGYSLTTLGTGDLVPTTAVFRLLMVLQATIGFSVLTLTLTYVMSVYTAIKQRNRFALTLHHLTGDSGDAAELLSRMDANGKGQEVAIRRALTEVTVGLDDLYESHHFYPILHYFFFNKPHYSMARVLYIALDAASMLRSGMLDADISRSAEAEAVWRSGRHALEHLAETFLPEQVRARERQSEGDELRWRMRYRSARERLRQSRMPEQATPDTAAEDRYVSLRREWDSRVRAFCRYMAYGWDEVAGADLRLLSERVRPHAHETPSAKS